MAAAEELLSAWLDAKELRPRPPRWTPSNTTANAMLASIFTWWNLLDQQMQFHDPVYRMSHGYMRELQLRRMLELVHGKHNACYCEIGMNGGHSAVAMLQANPTLHVHSFDIMRINYSWPIAQLLQSTFGERFTLHPGNSRVTVPHAATGAMPGQCTTDTPGGRRALRCDVLFVDGEHTAQGACIDTFHARGLAASDNAIVVMDDVIAGSGPNMVLHEFMTMSRLTLLERYGPYSPSSRHSPCQRTSRYGDLCGGWGFIIARYNQSGFLSPVRRCSEHACPRGC